MMTSWINDPIVATPLPLNKTRVLVVDDDAFDRDFLATRIASWGFVTETAEDGRLALDRATRFQPHIVVSDLRMPNMDGVGLIGRLREAGGHTPVILLSQLHDIHTAVSAVRDAGAYWFIEKPAPLETLRELLIRAAEHTHLREENERLLVASRERRLGQLVGNSAAIVQLSGLIERVAPTSATVLITGESGTGKEVVARAIHDSSERAGKPFVPVNCAALPESLIENELFGHERGAFTGASDRQMGRIEAAHGGTLFLDEIGELPTAMQAKLLRVLEENQVRRLGGKLDIPVDARVIAATNRAPEKAIRDGRLREDLFYRLNVFHFELPPLRERKEDIPLLTSYLLSVLSHRHGRSAPEIKADALQRLIDYDWPGNIRELRNVLERAVILCEGRPISRFDLPSDIRAHDLCAAVHPASEATGKKVAVPVGVSLREAERAVIEATLEHTGGNRRLTAEILGLSLKTIHTKLKEYRTGGNASNGGSIGPQHA